MIVRGSNLTDSMSAYLDECHRRPAADQGHLNAEVVGGHGDGQLELGTLCNRISGQEQELPLESLFVKTGARPRTEWLPVEVDRDQHGFLYTGAQAASCDSWTLARLPHPHETTGPKCLPSATCDRAQSSGVIRSRRKGRSSSPKSTSSWPRHMAEVAESRRGTTRIGLTAAVLAVPLPLA